MIMADGNDGRLQKMEMDYSTTVDERLPICEKLAKEGKLADALESLLSLEKQTRTAADVHSTGRILVGIVKLCFEMNDFESLNSHILLLTKRRGQLKQAVTKMVQEAYKCVEQTADLETKVTLIDTLRTVTAGKIYVEIERARLTRILAQIKENRGEISGAAEVLQELQVETFGSMEKKEKVEFILEQMRLCLAKKDYIRTQIISRKIATKVFDEEAFQELKLTFYQLMIELDAIEGSYLNICKHYRAIYDTKCVLEDKDRMYLGMQYGILYLILAPYDNEQSDLMYRMLNDKRISAVPVYMNILTYFTTTELMHWVEFCASLDKEMKQESSGPAAQVFDRNTAEGKKRWADLKIRVVEHNIRVMAKYYTRISLARMADLLDLSEAEIEEFLSSLVVNKTVVAKVDRLDGIVSFATAKDPSDLLDEWSRNVNSLMELVNRTTHLITKEEMVHHLN